MQLGAVAINSLLSLILLRKFHLNPILVMAVSGILGAAVYSIPW